MSRIGKYYQIGLATPKEGEEANSLVTIEDLVRKVSSEVIFYYEDYKSFFETAPETKEIYRGSVEEAFNCPKEEVKEFLNFSCESVEIGSTYLVGSIYCILCEEVKRAKWVFQIERVTLPNFNFFLDLPCLFFVNVLK